MLALDRALNDARGRTVRVLRLEQAAPDLSAVIQWEDHVTALFVAFGLLLLVLLAWVRFVERRTLASIGVRGERKLREFLRGLTL